MRTIHPEIFREFGVQVRKCYQIRATYMCETDKGIRAIRKVDCTPEQIILQHKIKEYLIKNGFSCVDRLYITKKNTPYVTHYDRTYIMTDWLNGQEVDFCNVYDIYQSIQLLAKMHIAGERFPLLPGYSSTIKIKNLGKTYRKRYHETIKLRKKINSMGNKTDFELLYLKNVPIYRELQEMAMEFVTPIQYESLINEARKKQTIAHHQYTYHNIIKINSNNIIITGFERSKYDVQLTDLAHVARRIMQKNSWDINLLSNIINEYNKIKPISSDEWKMLKGMLIFPEKFASLCNQYYHTKRRWNYNMFYRKFINMLDYQELQMDCANKIREW